MTAAVVKTKSSSPGSATGTTLALVMDQAFGVGNTAVVFAHHGDQTLAFPTLADNRSNTYTERTAARVTDTDNNNRLTAFTAENLAAGAVATLTLTWGSLVGFREIAVTELQGVVPTSSFLNASGNHQINPGVGADTISSGNVNVTTAPAMLIAFSTDDSTGTLVPNVGTGFTSVGSFNINSTSARWEQKRVVATGNVTATFGVSGGTSNYNTSALALLEADPPGPGIVPAQPVNRGSGSQAMRFAMQGRGIVLPLTAPAATGQNVTIGQALETDTSQPVTAAKALAVGQALETDTSQAAVARKSRTVGQALETDTAQTFTATKRLAVGLAVENDSAFAVTRGGQSVTVGQALETDSSQAVVAVKKITIGQAVENDTAQGVSWTKRLAIGLAIENGSALPFTFSGFTPAVASDAFLGHKHVLKGKALQGKALRTS